ncbi:MAG: AraC family transcriptional regulator [Saprospiraceae bacterium]|nr:AraC family transcriptional regulator [Saprospiraceae bacterium]
MFNFSSYQVHFIRQHIFPRTSDEAHRHKYYEIFLFEQGPGEHMIDFNKYSIAPRSLQIVCPNQLHHVKRSAESCGSVLLVHADHLEYNPSLNSFFNAIKYNHLFQNSVIIQEEEYEILQRQLLLLNQIPETVSDNSYLILSTFYLVVNLLERYQSEAFKQQKHLPSVFNDFINLVEKNFQEKKTADFYARELNLSARKLSSIVEQRTGMSTKKFLIYRIILEAKRLLKHSQMSVKEIAYHLDFLEAAHFSNFFKKYTGVSPSQFA